MYATTQATLVQSISFPSGPVGLAFHRFLHTAAPSTASPLIKPSSYAAMIPRHWIKRSFKYLLRIERLPKSWRTSIRCSALCEKWSMRWREYVWTLSRVGSARSRTVRRYMCRKVTCDQVENVGRRPSSMNQRMLAEAQNLKYSQRSA